MLIEQNLPDWIRIKKSKRVITHDLDGEENGYLVDILNRHDDIFQGREEEPFQQVYYTSVYRGMFKGFHIHPKKIDTVSSVFGRSLLVLYPELPTQGSQSFKMDLDKLLVIPLDADEDMLTVSFPSKYPHGYFGVSDLSLILNYRNPAWHSGDKLQYDYKHDGVTKYLTDWIQANEKG